MYDWHINLLTGRLATTYPEPGKTLRDGSRMEHAQSRRDWVSLSPYILWGLAAAGLGRWWERGHEAWNGRMSVIAL